MTTHTTHRPMAMNMSAFKTRFLMKTPITLFFVCGCATSLLLNSHSLASTFKLTQVTNRIHANHIVPLILFEVERVDARLRCAVSTVVVRLADAPIRVAKLQLACATIHRRQFPDKRRRDIVRILETAGRPESQRVAAETSGHLCTQEKVPSARHCKQYLRIYWTIRY